mgnify:FL=1
MSFLGSRVREGINRARNFLRLSGPALLPNAHFAPVGYVFAVVFALAFRTDFGFVSVILNLLINAIVVTCIWGISHGAKATIFRNRFERDIPAWQVVAFGGFLGIVAHSVHGFTSAALRLTTFPVTTVSLAFAAAIGAIAIVMSSITERQRLYRRRVLRLQEVESGDAEGLSRLLSNASRAFDELQARVDNVIDASPPGAESSTVLERVIDDAIKPLSRQLLQSSRTRFEPLLIRGVARSVLAFDPYAKAWWVALIYALGIIVVNQFPIYGQERAEASFFAGAIGFMTVGTILSIARRFLRPSLTQVSRRTVALHLLPFLVLAPLQTTINQSFFWPQIELQIFLSGLLINGLQLLAMSALFSLSSSPPDGPLVLHASGAGEGTSHPWMTGEWGRATVQALLRELTQHMHGTVQNKVLALRLSGGIADSNDLPALKVAISEIISEAREDFQNNHRVSFEEKIQKLQDDWQPIATIAVESTLPTLSPLRSAVLFMVIQEAVTNSIRHGLSKTVTINLRPGDSSRRVSIEILDDGTGPLQRRGKRGVGLSFLAALSEGSWSLTVREGGGARLVASLWC